ncbi:MAG TPA: hypothetical protein DCO72_07095 [Ruminococcus sp.]|nr:hypothetical protein [Ruminococcus sp.]
MGRIKVKGSARMKFQAELLEMNFTIQGSGKSSGTAIADGKKKVEQLLLTMQEQLSLNPESFRLESDTVSENYNRNSYTFVKKISIVVKADLSMLEQLTDLVSEIPDTTYSTNFKLDNVPEKEKTVIQRAFDDARKKADMIASCSGQIVTGVDEINYEYHAFTEENEMLRGIAVASGAVSQKFASKLSLPEEEISKEVNVIFLIESKA